LVNLGQRWRKKLATDMRSGVVGGTTFSPLHPITQRARKQQELAITFGRAADLRSLKKQARRERIDRNSIRAASLRDKTKRLKTAYADLGFGGRLPRLIEFATPKDGSLRVGFIGKIFRDSVRSAARWMRKESRGWTKAERRWLHVMFGETIPYSAYLRPERPPVAPQQREFSADVQTSIPKTIQRVRDSAAKKGK
jgi:hypothetical protein